MEYRRRSPRMMRTTALIAGSDTQNNDDMPSPASAQGIVMLSLPDSQDALPQDVFHTPPEYYSLPSDDDQRRAPSDAVHSCAVNYAVDVDAGIQGFVDFCDLGKDSELGFSEVQITQPMDVGEHGPRSDVLGDIRDCELDEFEVFEKELSDCAELRVKKPELSGQDLGVYSSGHCLKGETGMEEKYSEENVETVVGGVRMCEAEKVVCTVGGSKCSEGEVDACGVQKKNDEEPTLRVLPPSICGAEENAVTKTKCVSSQKKSVFDVLKSLAEEGDDIEESVDHLSLLDVARARGLTFPRPRWWPDDDNFEPKDQMKFR